MTELLWMLSTLRNKRADGRQRARLGRPSLSTRRRAECTSERRHADFRQRAENVAIFIVVVVVAIS